MSDGDAIDLRSLLALCAPHGDRERQTSDERTPPLGKFRGETERITISYTRTPYLFLRNGMVSGPRPTGHVSLRPTNLGRFFRRPKGSPNGTRET